MLHTSAVSGYGERRLTLLSWDLAWFGLRRFPSRRGPPCPTLELSRSPPLLHLPPGSRLLEVENAPASIELWTLEPRQPRCGPRDLVSILVVEHDLVLNFVANFVIDTPGLKQAILADCPFVFHFRPFTETGKSPPFLPSPVCTALPLEYPILRAAHHCLYVGCIHMIWSSAIGEQFILRVCLASRGCSFAKPEDKAFAPFQHSRTPSPFHSLALGMPNPCPYPPLLQRRWCRCKS
jgi:hypothetical protein